MRYSDKMKKESMKVKFAKAWVVKAYTNFDIPYPKFFKKYVIPTTSLGILIYVIIRLLVPSALTIPYAGPLITFTPLICLLLILLYPIMRRSKREHDIDSNMNLFITRMGALSVSNLPRKTLVKMLSEVDEYKALADEMKYIHNLMDMWNYGLPEAAKYVAERLKTTNLLILLIF